MFYFDSAYNFCQLIFLSLHLTTFEDFDLYRIEKRMCSNCQGPSSPSAHVSSMEENPHLTKMSAYHVITELVDGTWKHGKDLRRREGPHHYNRLEITHVFEVRNMKLLKQYNNKKDQVTQETDLPNELINSPILTANTGNVEYDELVEDELQLNVDYPTEAFFFTGQS